MVMLSGRCECSVPALRVGRIRFRVAAEPIGSLYGLSPEAVLESPYALTGSVDEIVAKFMEERERLGVSYITVYEKDMQVMAPIVARLAGK